MPVVVKDVALTLVAFNEAKLVNPETFNPLRAPNPVILPPTPTLPVVVIVPVEREVEVMAPVFIDVAFNPARLVRPVTFNPLRAPNPVILPQTPTLPVVVKVVALIEVVLRA